MNPSAGMFAMAALAALAGSWASWTACRVLGGRHSLSRAAIDAAVFFAVSLAVLCVASSVTAGADREPAHTCAPTVTDWFGR